MKLFKRKEREPKRYWDFSYISNFIQRYRIFRVDNGEG